MSAHIGLFYGSTTGHTDAVAELIRDEFGRGMVKLHCMAETKKQDFANYNYLIIGSPTWHIGKLQSDWEAFFPELDEIDFNGKQVAYFGLGDQLEYPYNFLDAMGILAYKITSRGGVRVGSWSALGYDFQESKALIGSKFTQLANGVEAVNGEFVGLGIDEENQPELTEERIRIWVTQIKQMMGV